MTTRLSLAGAVLSALERFQQLRRHFVQTPEALAGVAADGLGIAKIDLILL